jgi:hypothetical protein
MRLSMQYKRCLLSLLLVRFLSNRTFAFGRQGVVVKECAVLIRSENRILEFVIRCEEIGMRFGQQRHGGSVGSHNKA